MGKRGKGGSVKGGQGGEERERKVHLAG